MPHYIKESSPYLYILTFRGWTWYNCSALTEIKNLQVDEQNSAAWITSDAVWSFLNIALLLYVRHFLISSADLEKRYSDARLSWFHSVSTSKSWNRDLKCASTASFHFIFIIRSWSSWVDVSQHTSIQLKSGITNNRQRMKFLPIAVSVYSGHKIRTCE
jgi:hypothetical protein